MEFSKNILGKEKRKKKKEKGKGKKENNLAFFTFYFITCLMFIGKRLALTTKPRTKVLG